MKIEYIYSKGNSDHLKLKRMIQGYCRDMGVRVVFTDRKFSVEEPVVVIDGYKQVCRLGKKSKNGKKALLIPPELTQLIERRAWL